jgi:hypothetical protein
MKTIKTFFDFHLPSFFGQNENRKPLHGQFTNESTMVDNGYVINLNSKKTRTLAVKVFDILAKAKDTLLVSSASSQKIVIQDFCKTAIYLLWKHKLQY